MGERLHLPIHKDLRKLCRQAMKEGFTCEKRGSGHFRLEHPDGASFTIASTPSSGAIRDARKGYQRALQEIKK